MLSRIKDRVSASGVNDGKLFIITIIRIMREFKQTKRQVLDMPIPEYIEIVKYLREEDQRKKEHGKK